MVTISERIRKATVMFIGTHARSLLPALSKFRRGQQATGMLGANDDELLVVTMSKAEAEFISEFFEADLDAFTSGGVQCSYHGLSLQDLFDVWKDVAAKL